MSEFARHVLSQPLDVLSGPVEANPITAQEKRDLELNPGHKEKIANLYALTQNILQQTRGQGANLVLPKAWDDYEVTVRRPTVNLPKGEAQFNQIRISRVEPDSLEHPLAYNVYPDRVRLLVRSADTWPRAVDSPNNTVGTSEIVLIGRQLDIALEELNPIIKSFPDKYLVERDEQPVKKAGLKRGAFVLATMLAVSALPTLYLKNLEDDKEYRQNITAEQLGLPEGRTVKIIDKVHPKFVDVPIEPNDLYALMGAERYFELGEKFWKPKADDVFTPDDGVRLVRLGITGECKSVPLQGDYDPYAHDVISWSPFKGIGGNSFRKYVTLAINHTEDTGFTIDACSIQAPGVFDRKFSSRGLYPMQDSAEVLVDVVSKSQS